MNRIAQATAEERRRIIDEFVDSIFAGIPADGPGGDFQATLRSVTADLPDDPTDEQVDAWIELAELLRDEGFQAKLRAMGQRSFGGDAPAVMPNGPEMMRLAQIVADRVGAAMEAGVTPASPEAGPVVDELIAPWVAAVGRTDDPEYRRELLEQLDLSYEPRAERYWQLMAIINGWPPIEPVAHRWAWLADALRARL